MELEWVPTNYFSALKNPNQQEDCGYNLTMSLQNTTNYILLLFVSSQGEIHTSGMLKQSRDNTSNVSVLTYETVIYISYETENLYTAELEKKQSVNEGKITYAAYNTPFKIYNKKMYPAFLCLLIPGASPLLLCTKENVLWLY